MVSHGATVFGCVQHQAELVTDSRLAAELGQAGGPQRGFSGLLIEVDVRIQRIALFSASHSGYFARLRSAARNSTATEMSGSPTTNSATRSQAASASLVE